MTLKH